MGPETGSKLPTDTQHAPSASKDQQPLGQKLCGRPCLKDQQRHLQGTFLHGGALCYHLLAADGTATMLH